jgi:hypothetical protein
MAADADKKYQQGVISQRTYEVLTARAKRNAS